MKNIPSETPTQAKYRILNLIEQIVTVAPKGTALGLSDVISAMFSGHFIESGGAVTPAIEGFLRREIQDEKEREARTRRAAKAIPYGSYNLLEMMNKLRDIVQTEGNWKPVAAQGYRVTSVDFSPFRRAAVKKLKAKAYVSDANRAVSAVPIGMIASVGVVNGQRIALLKEATVANLTCHDEQGHKKKLYRQVAKGLEQDEIAVFDAGFSLAGAVEADISQCLIRLAKNCTFGKTPGKIPERASDKGRKPTQYKAEIVRPLARKHGQKTIAATEADEIHTIIDESGREIEVYIWKKVYFLERHLKRITDERKKKRLRRQPLQIMAIDDPDYDEPLLVGTPLLSLQPEAARQVYCARWPMEGLP